MHDCMQNGFVTPYKALLFVSGKQGNGRRDLVSHNAQSLRLIEHYYSFAILGYHLVNLVKLLHSIAPKAKRSRLSSCIIKTREGPTIAFFMLTAILSQSSTLTILFPTEMLNFVYNSFRVILFMHISVNGYSRSSLSYFFLGIEHLYHLYHLKPSRQVKHKTIEVWTNKRKV